jgi:membrane protease YdiL (CAAX protease family)
MGAASLIILLGGSLALRLLHLEPLTLVLAVSALEVVALMGSVYVLGLRRRHLTWQAVGVRGASLGWVAVAIAFGLLCIWVTGLVALLVQRLLGLSPTNVQLPFLAPAGFSWVAAIGMFVLVGVLIPFAEEVYFRGVLYTWLRQRWGVRVGILASALIFGAVHGDIAIAAGIFVMALFQAWVFERSRSLWTPFLIHAINNGTKVALLYVLLAMGLKLT